MTNEVKPASLPFYLRGAGFLLFLALLVALLYCGRPILVPVVTALLFAFLVMPIVRKLESWQLPAWLASLAGVLTVILCVIAMVLFFSWQFSHFLEDMPTMEQAMETKKKSIFRYIESHYDISRREQAQWWDQKTTEMLNAGASGLMGFFTATWALFATMVLIPIFMFFLLLYRQKFKRFIELLNPDRSDEMLEIMRKISRVSQQYIRGMFIVIIILTVLNAIGFLLIGLKYAILLAFMAALLNIIPYIGVLIGSLIPVAVALVTKDSVIYAFAAFGICSFVQFLENNFITPKIVGSSVNLNPLASILALLGGALLWGVPGMVLGIPLLGMFKVVCDHVARLRPLGFVLGEETEYKPFRFKRVRIPGLKKPASTKKEPTGL